MSNTNTNLERFQELKEKGWTKLNGDERNEYQALKLEFPELDEADETEEETTPAEKEVKAPKAVIADDEQSNDEETEEKKTPKPLKRKAGDKRFVLLGNLKHDGVLYEKGTEFAANDPILSVTPAEIYNEI